MQKMHPDELHHLTGPFGKLYKSCKKYYPKLEEWSNEVCFQKKYHGGTFTGGDCKRLLECIDELEWKMMEYHDEENDSVIGLRFVAAFRALEAVRKSCFGKVLQEGWENALKNLKEEITDLKDDEDCEMSCTLKFHVLFFHAWQWCKKEGRGLGTVSTQAGEAMHSRFEKFMKRYSDPLQAVSQWNSRVLWPQPDEEGDQE